MTKWQKVIDQKVAEIQEQVGKNKAVVALSGGVDSSVVAVLGHLALGSKMKALFVENGIMRQGEPQLVKKIFKGMGINVQILNAKKDFFNALKGKTDPEIKRQAITDTFYADIFSKFVSRQKIKCLLQGTILTDIDETVAGIKRQHNVLAQLGINPEKEYGYQVIEPLIDLRKDGVRKLARALKMPKEITERIPFPGPALATRYLCSETLGNTVQLSPGKMSRLSFTGVPAFNAAQSNDVFKLTPVVSDARSLIGHEHRKVLKGFAAR